MGFWKWLLEKGLTQLWSIAELIAGAFITIFSLVYLVAMLLTHRWLQALIAPQFIILGILLMLHGLYLGEKEGRE